MNKKTIIYSRVSTGHQNVSSQNNILIQHCKNSGDIVVDIINETISGVAKSSERDGINKLMYYCKNHLVEQIVVFDLSRLGRSVIQVLTLLEEISNLSINIHIFTMRMDTMLDSGKKNPMSEILCTTMAVYSSIERNSIRERVLNGVINYRKEHEGKWGRRIGSVKNSHQFLKENSLIVKYLKKGLSIRATATLCKKSTNTVLKAKRLMTT